MAPYGPGGAAGARALDRVAASHACAHHGARPVPFTGAAGARALDRVARGYALAWVSRAARGRHPVISGSISGSIQGSVLFSGFAGGGAGGRGHEDGGWPLTPRGCRGLRCADRRTRSSMGFIERREENSRWGNCWAIAGGAAPRAGVSSSVSYRVDCVDYEIDSAFA